jgi:hypothetical protein
MSREIDDGMRHGGLVYSSQEEKELDRVQTLYNELIYAVARKWPGETRHQTALRYIQQAESRPAGVGQASLLRQAVVGRSPAQLCATTPRPIKGSSDERPYPEDGEHPDTGATDQQPEPHCGRSDR